MTIFQKEQVKQRRLSGDSYGLIAAELNISEGTVKTFCRRNNIGLSIQTSKNNTVCLQCGLSLTHTPHKRQKKFCSDKCRLAWWNSHQDQVNRKANYNFICIVCGKEFTAYGDNDRRFCSRACFGLSRKVAK